MLSRYQVVSPDTIGFKALDLIKKDMVQIIPCSRLSITLTGFAVQENVRSIADFFRQSSKASIEPSQADTEVPDGYYSCSICREILPLEGHQEHEDYHVALKLQKEHEPLLPVHIQNHQVRADKKIEPKKRRAKKQEDSNKKSIKLTHFFNKI